MQSKTNSSYDVIVVGSGASGGWACKRLAEAGVKVAMLEAGRPQSDANFTEHKPAFELKYRNEVKANSPNLPLATTSAICHAVCRIDETRYSK